MVSLGCLAFDLVVTLGVVSAASFVVASAALFNLEAVCEKDWGAVSGASD